MMMTTTYVIISTQLEKYKKCQEQAVEAEHRSMVLDDRLIN